jgi:hypothetical protein
MRVLGINAVFHDSAAAVVADGDNVELLNVLELFGSAPVDALAIGPYLAQRP